LFNHLTPPAAFSVVTLFLKNEYYSSIVSEKRRCFNFS
jgi:hypothetical protein